MVHLAPLSSGTTVLWLRLRGRPTIAYSPTQGHCAVIPSGWAVSPWVASLGQCRVLNVRRDEDPLPSPTQVLVVFPCHASFLETLFCLSASSQACPGPPSPFTARLEVAPTASLALGRAVFSMTNTQETQEGGPPRVGAGFWLASLGGGKESFSRMFSFWFLSYFLPKLGWGSGEPG